MLQNQTTTSHYTNFPVEHKWELPSVASGNRITACFSKFKLLANQTFPWFLSIPVWLDLWLQEFSFVPLFFQSHWVVKTQRGLKFPQIPFFFPPHFLYKQNCSFSCCYVLIWVNVSLSHINKRHWQGICQWNLGVITQNSNDKNHLSLITPRPLKEQSTVTY